MSAKRVLIDTQVLLWMLSQPERLGKKAAELLDAVETEIWLSSASIFEISVKWSLKKLPLPEPPGEYLPRFLDQMRVTELIVNQHHAYRVADLPWHHRDPFDRLILAQALVEKLPLVTSDEQMFFYKLKTIDARK